MGDRLELGVLHATQPSDVRIIQGLAGDLFAEIDERKGIKRTRQNQLARPLGRFRSTGQGVEPVTQHQVNRVRIGAPKPILGVPVIRFAPVQDGVDQGTVTVGEILHDVVGGIVVVVVEQAEGAQAERRRGLDVVFGEERIQLAFQVAARTDPKSWSRPELGRLGRADVAAEKRRDWI